MGFRRNLIGKTDPLITKNWQEADVELPFEGFNKNAHPKVTKTPIHKNYHRYFKVLRNLWRFQEYERSLELLRKVYYPDTTNTSAVELENMNLMSDLMINDSILKQVVLQTNANNEGVEKANTFLFR